MATKRRRWAKSDLDSIYRASSGRCRVCGHGHTRNDHGKTWNIDHVIPFSKGGSSSGFNLALTCIKCNSKRGNQNNIGDVAETAARKALQMERASRGRSQNGRSPSKRRGGNQSGNGGPMIHITTMPSLANGSTLCRRPASRPENRSPTCPRCIQLSRSFMGMLFGV